MNKNVKKFRVIAMCFIIFALVVTSVISIFNFDKTDDAKASFSQRDKIISALAELYGSSEKAEEVFNTLRANALIDDEGNISVIHDMFIVDGVEMTKAQLYALASASDEWAPVNVDGVDLTWGDIQDLIVMNDTLSVVNECIGSNAKLTDTHLTSLNNLMNYIKYTGISLNATSTPANDPNASKSFVQGLVFSVNRFTYQISNLTNNGSTSADGGGMIHFLIQGSGKIPDDVKLEYQVTGMVNCSGPASGIVDSSYIQGQQYSFRYTASPDFANGNLSEDGSFVIQFKLKGASFSNGLNIFTQSVQIPRKSPLSVKDGDSAWKADWKTKTIANDSNAKLETLWSVSHQYTAGNYTTGTEVYNYNSIFSQPSNSALYNPEARYNATLILYPYNGTYKDKNNNNIRNYERIKHTYDAGSYVRVYLGNELLFESKTAAKTEYANYGSLPGGETMKKLSDTNWGRFTDNYAVYYEQNFTGLAFKKIIGQQLRVETKGVHAANMDPYGWRGTTVEDDIAEASTYVAELRLVDETVQTVINLIDNKLDIPTGTFYPGEIVPITATFSDYIVASSTKLVVNGKDYIGRVGTDRAYLANPMGATGFDADVSKKVVYYYRVNEIIDSGSVVIGGLFDKDGGTGGIRDLYGNMRTLANDQNEIKKNVNINCKLRTPSKMSTFSGIKFTEKFHGDFTKQRIITDIKINETVFNGTDVLYEWLLATSQDTDPDFNLDEDAALTDYLKTTYGLGNEGSSLELYSNYVQSIFLSTNGGETNRYKLYLLVDKAPRTIGGKTIAEIPIALISCFNPASFLSEGDYPNGIYQFLNVFYDSDIASITNYHDKNADGTYKHGRPEAWIEAGGGGFELNNNTVTTKYCKFVAPSAKTLGTADVSLIGFGFKSGGWWRYANSNTADSITITLDNYMKNLNPEYTAEELALIDRTRNSDAGSTTAYNFANPKTGDKYIIPKDSYIKNYDENAWEHNKTANDPDAADVSLTLNPGEGDEYYRVFKYVYENGSWQLKISPEHGRVETTWGKTVADTYQKYRDVGFLFRNVVNVNVSVDKIEYKSVDGVWGWYFKTGGTETLLTDYGKNYIFLNFNEQIVIDQNVNIEIIARDGIEYYFDYDRQLFINDTNELTIPKNFFESGRAGDIYKRETLVTFTANKDGYYYYGLEKYAPIKDIAKVDGGYKKNEVFVVQNIPFKYNGSEWVLKYGNEFVSSWLVYNGIQGYWDLDLSFSIRTQLYKAADLEKGSFEAYDNLRTEHSYLYNSGLRHRLDSYLDSWGYKQHNWENNSGIVANPGIADGDYLGIRVENYISLAPGSQPTAALYFRYNGTKACWEPVIFPKSNFVIDNNILPLDVYIDANVEYEYKTINSVSGWYRDNVLYPDFTSAAPNVGDMYKDGIATYTYVAKKNEQSTNKWIGYIENDNRIILAYDISSLKKDSDFVDPDYFIWKSSDETIATLKTQVVTMGGGYYTGTFYYTDKDGVTQLGSWNEAIISGMVNKPIKIAVVEFTGKTGSVDITLTATNGGGVTAASSLVFTKTINIEESNAPYFAVASKDRTIFEGEALDISFTSSLTAYNAMQKSSPASATNFKLEVYRCDASGNTTGAAVYEETKVSTKENTVSGFSIPENILTAIGAGAYKAILTADEYEGYSVLKTHKTEVVINVKSTPLKVALAKTATNAYVSKDDINLDWSIKGLSKATQTAEIIITVTRSGSSTPIVSERQSGASIASSGKINIPKSLYLSDLNGLKSVYVVQIQVRASASESFAIDAQIIYIYNHDALKVLVGDNVQADGSSSTPLVLDNEAHIISLLSADKKTINLGGGSVSLEQLSKDTHLSEIVSINYNQYVWGALSDQIAWVSTDYNVASLNYKRAGFYANIESYNLPSYMPIADFMLVGLNDGKTTIKATHVQTGVSREFEVTVKTLKDKLFLIQTYPKMKAQLMYTNGNGEQIKNIWTNDKGELALYEPSGIVSDIKFLGKLNDVTYVGSIANHNILTSEQDISRMVVYPINKVKLAEISSVTYYIKNPNGTPYANKNISIKGGVYLDSLYCPEAGFSLKAGDSVGTNGRIAQTAKTDSLGRLTLYFNSAQFYDFEHIGQETELFPDTYIDYVFEMITADSNYYPLVARVSSKAMSLYNKSVLSATVNLTVKDASAGGVYVDRYSFDNGYSSKTIDVDIVGPSETIGYKDIYVNTYINYTQIALGQDETTGYAKLDTSAYKLDSMLTQLDGTPLNGQMGTGEARIITNLDDLLVDLAKPYDGQNTYIYTYPFSTYPTAINRYNMNEQTTTNDWLKPKDKKGAMLYIYENGSQQKAFQLPFSLTNMIGVADPKQSGQLGNIGQSILEDVGSQMDIGGALGGIDGGAILSLGMSFFSGLATGSGDYAINIITVPTENPYIYKMIVSVGKPQEGGGGDGVSMEYSEESTEYLQELAGMNDDDEDDDDEDSPTSPFTLKFRGTIIMTAFYDPDDDQWEFVMSGGGFGASIGLEYEYKTNFFIGFVPVTINFKAEAALNIDLNFDTVYNTKSSGAVDAYKETMFNIGLEGGIEAFAGVGIDYSVIALKIGIFGSVNIGLDFKVLNSQYLEAVKGEDATKTGTQFTLDGEIGIRFTAQILMLKYEYTFASASFGYTKSWGSYDYITDYWEGKTQQGARYTATMFADGRMLFAVENADAGRDYLHAFSRVWMSGGGMPVYMLNDNIEVSTVLQTAYPDATPSITSDGEMLVFVSDNNSASNFDTSVSYAKYNAGNNTFDAVKTVESEKNGYGDTYLTTSGANGNYFASWTKQTQVVKYKVIKEGNQVEEIKPASELTPDELAFTLNSSEIYASVYDKTADSWKTTKLTDNSYADLTPAIASSGNKAIVAWRNGISSKVENLLDFDVQDYVMYSIYDGSNWSQAKVAYDGNCGHILEIKAAAMADGTFIIGYTIASEDDLDYNYDSEVMYSVVNSEGAVYSTKLTNDNNPDESLNVAVVKYNENRQEKEAFILGWYTEKHDFVEDNGTVKDALLSKDVKLISISSTGVISATFPESAAQLGADSISKNFRFAYTEGADIGELAIVWYEDAKDSGELNFGAHHIIKTALLYQTADEYIGITSAHKVVELNNYVQLSSFSPIFKNSKLSFAAIVDDYAAGAVALAGTIDFADIVSKTVLRKNYETQEAYQQAFDAEVARLQVEYNQEKLNIFASYSRSDIIFAQFDFTDGIEVFAPEFKANQITRGFGLPMTFTLRNTGVNTITKLVLTIGEESETIENLTILPNAYYEFTYYFDLAPNAIVENVQYSLSAFTENQTELTFSGTIVLDMPDIGVKNITVIEAGEGKRTVSYELYNNTDIPLSGTGKKVHVGFYGKPACDSDSLLFSEEFTAEAGSVSELIDAGSYTAQSVIDVNELIAIQYPGNAAIEIPVSGLRIYIKVWIEDAGSVLKEQNTSNNASFGIINSMQNSGSLVSVVSQLKHETNGDVTVDIIATNNSLNQQTLQAMKVSLYDNSNKLICSQNLGGGSDITLEPEKISTYTTTFSAASLNSKVAVKAVFATMQKGFVVSFDFGRFATAGQQRLFSTSSRDFGTKVYRNDLSEDENDALNEEIPTPYVIENYQFNGWKVVGGENDGMLWDMYAEAVTLDEILTDVATGANYLSLVADYSLIPAVIGIQPVKIQKAYDGTGTLTVAATHTLPVTYQWYKANYRDVEIDVLDNDGNPTGAKETVTEEVEPTKLEGKTSETLDRKNVADNGIYFCVATVTDAISSQTTVSNYAEVDISKVDINVTVSNLTIKYGETPVFAFTATGFVNGETAATAIDESGAAYVCAGINASATPYTITLSGLKSDNYNIASCTSGNLTIEKRTVTITARNVSRNYDGTAFTDGNYTVTGDGFIEGEGATISVTGTIKYVGSATNTVSYTLSDGTNSDNYDITTVNGSLTILQSSIALTLTSDSDSKTYDGTALTKSSYSFSGTLASGDVIEITYTGTITNSGTAANAYTYRIMNGTTDVTANYVITKNVGTLTINKRAITITSDSDSKTYDGTALTKSSYSFSGTLADGNEIEITYTGTITNSGTADNAYTYRILNGSTDVTENYSVTKIAGTLTINKRELTITSDSDSKIYDAAALTKGSYVVTSGTLADNQNIFASFTGTITQAGSCENAFSVIIKNSGGTDVSSNYTVTIVFGTLTVDKRDVTITTGSTKRTYNGSELKNESFALTVGTLASDHIFDLTFLNGITDPGVVSNSVTAKIMSGSIDVSQNYNITVIDGVLTVTQIIIAVKENSSSDIIMESAGGLDPDYKMLAQTLDKKDFRKVKLSEAVGRNRIIKQIYEIELFDGSAQVQPENQITMRLKVSEKLLKSKHLEVIFIDDNGFAKNMNAKLVDGYMVFTTDHLSVYAITDTNVQPYGFTLIILGAILLIFAILLVPGYIYQKMAAAGKNVNGFGSVCIKVQRNVINAGVVTVKGVKSTAKSIFKKKTPVEGVELIEQGSAPSATEAAITPEAEFAITPAATEPAMAPAAAIEPAKSDEKTSPPATEEAITPAAEPAKSAEKTDGPARKKEKAETVVPKKAKAETFPETAATVVAKNSTPEEVGANSAENPLNGDIDSAKIITKYVKPNNFVIKLATITTKVLNDHFNSGDIVNLKTLKDKKLIPAASNKLKVLAGGTISKALTVEADVYTTGAINMILLPGGKVVRIITK